MNAIEWDMMRGIDERDVIKADLGDFMQGQVGIDIDTIEQDEYKGVENRVSKRYRIRIMFIIFTMCMLITQVLSYILNSSQYYNIYYLIDEILY